MSEVILVIDHPLEFRARVSLNDDPAVLNPQFKSVFLPLSFPLSLDSFLAMRSLSAVNTSSRLSGSTLPTELSVVAALYQGPPNIEHLCSMFECSFVFGEHSNTRTWV